MFTSENKFKILVATDYSEEGISAELYGIQFAKNTDSILYMVHVTDKTLNYNPEEPLNLAQTKNDILEVELNILKLHRDKLFYLLDIDENDIACECIVREGKSGKQICNEADKLNIDFIIIRAHATNSFKDLIFGNQTWNVIKNANVPVLVIPKNTFFTGIRSIVFATDYREGEIPVINYLVQFAKQFEASVTLLHVSDYVISKNVRKTLFDYFRNEIIKGISYDKLDMRLAYHNDITSGINDFCSKSKIDLLVMSHVKRFLLGNILNPITSVTRKMSFNTHIPLLSIPDYYNTDGSKFWELFDMDKQYAYEDY